MDRQCKAMAPGSERASALAFIAVLALVSRPVLAQEHRLPLYAGAIPNSRPTSVNETTEKADYTKVTHVTVPEMAVYLPTRRFATGQAVVICPGGGYVQLSVDLEGSDIARYLTSIGVAGVVLKYRLPSKESNLEPATAPLMDAQRALRLVRHNAERWNIRPDEIGVMGFSAGGHLASTLATNFDRGNPSSDDAVERQSCRPDFLVLGYPTVSFTDAVKRTRSRQSLLGDNPSEELVVRYSNERQVTDDTPPAFIVHAGDDETVPVENALLLYEALRRKGRPAELHIVSEGGHGFGLALDRPHTAAWTASLRLWLRALRGGAGR